MAEIDPVEFQEIGIIFLLVLQFILAVIVAGLEYFCGRRKRPAWVRAGFLLSLLSAVVACGLTLNGCWDTRNYIESRRDNPLRYERIKNDLVEVRWWALESGAILAATAGGSALLYRVARLGRVAVPAN